uniref:Cytochrome P450 3A56 n=1 Tax=Aceria tosichella TaxID=561515 RepID=A0A6G1SM40_9ACAR
MILNLILDYVADKLFVYQFVSTLTTYLALRLFWLFRVRRRRHQLLALYGIPGPKPRLLDGSLHMYRESKTAHLMEVELQKKYGKVFGIYIGDEANVIITDLELLRKIFFEYTTSFKERATVFMESPLSKSILFATHNRWKPMRKIMSPPFSTFTMRGQASTNFIEDVVKLMLDYIEDKMRTQEKTRAEATSPSTSPTRITLDIHSLMQATALRLITGLAIDLPDVQVRENEPYVESLDSFLSQADGGVVILAIRFPFLKPIVEFLATHIEHGKTMSSIRRQLNKKIDEGMRELNGCKNGKSQPKTPQLIDTFIKLHHEGKLSRDEVIGNAEALLFAGYDTTSTTLVYIFWVLGKYPEIQERLRGELMAHGVESKYLMQVINEVMRLYPTVIRFTTRLATENVTIDDLTLPKGVKVAYNAWLMFRDPELWPEPEKFDPERFREGVQIHPCAFAPFGLSERKCLGYSLAQLELKTVVCDLVCRYRIFTKAPDVLSLVSYATVLTKPSEKIIVELERI